MKINNFRGELTDILAKKEGLATASFLSDQASDSVCGFYSIQNMGECLNVWSAFGTVNLASVLVFTAGVI